MELWIRSQDREKLLKVNLITLTRGDDVTWYLENGDYILGVYKTKERALEVLDKIQKLLMPKVKIIHNKIKQNELLDFTSDVILQPMIEDIQVQQATCYVYQMPKK